MVIGPSGEVLNISGWNRVRRADELIIFTPDYGSHTYTNEWGVEIYVEDGEVIYTRLSGDTTPMEIHDGGYVISGIGPVASQLRNFKEWDWVELE